MMLMERQEIFTYTLVQNKNSTDKTLRKILENHVLEDLGAKLMI